MLTTLSDFKCNTFNFEDREAIIVFPKVKANGNWVLKTEYWGAFPDVEIKLLEKGFHVAFVQNKSRFAPKSECELKARFVKYISKEYGLNEKCVPIGMSCGGAHAVRFAGFYPELVLCMYIDAPVLNFCDFPGKVGKPEFEKAWEEEFLSVYPGVKRYQLLKFSEHPINMTDILIENKIPIIMVYGAEDNTVSYTENGFLLENAMVECDFLKVIKVEYRGHHPHGMTDENSPIVDFITSHC